MLVLAKANYEIRFDARAGRLGTDHLPVVAHRDQRDRGRPVRPVQPRRRPGLLLRHLHRVRRPGDPAQMLETEDFLHFKVSTLNGPEVRNKGFALFPRMVNGQYAMLSRQDNENIYLMYSDMPHFWYSKELIAKPTYSWEFVQLGNCGSPIETEAGWLVLTHGVGPMRKYALGAFLLDRDDPVADRTTGDAAAGAERQRTRGLRAERRL